MPASVATANRVSSSSAGDPGKSEAVWPSAPTPSRTTRGTPSVRNSVSYATRRPLDADVRRDRVPPRPGGHPVEDRLPHEPLVREGIVRRHAPLVGEPQARAAPVGLRRSCVLVCDAAGSTRRRGRSTRPPRTASTSSRATASAAAASCAPCDCALSTAIDEFPSPRVDLRRLERRRPIDALAVPRDPTCVPVRAPTGCSVTSATYASSSVGSRVVTRPTETSSSRASSSCVGSCPLAACTTTTCAWSRSSTATPSRRRSTAARPPSRPRCRRPRSRPPSPRRPALEVARGALGDDPSLRDHRDPVAERVRLEHVVGRQQHGLPRRLEARDRRRSSRAPTGSTPMVGSSRKTTAGSWSRPRAMWSRCRMPREYPSDPLLLAPASARRARAAPRCERAGDSGRRRTARRSSGDCPRRRGARRGLRSPPKT